jgi:hypothetical protein
VWERNRILSLLLLLGTVEMGTMDTEEEERTMIVISTMGMKDLPTA